MNHSIYSNVLHQSLSYNVVRKDTVERRAGENGKRELKEVREGRGKEKGRKRRKEYTIMRIVEDVLGVRVAVWHLSFGGVGWGVGDVSV
jgi:hypothetical protein